MTDAGAGGTTRRAAGTGEATEHSSRHPAEELALPAAPSRHSVAAAFTRHRLGVAGLGLVVAIALFSYVGPLLYHANELSVNILATNAAPGAGRPLGTDANGFDILGRLMLGGQASLELGLAVALAATTLGSLWGAISGMAGGLLDAAMMRLVDMLISVPAIFVLIFLATVLRPTIWVLIVALSLMSWPAAARLVRGETLSLRAREFVEAARVSGGSRPHNICRHILPNAFDTILVNATFQAADAIIVLAALSFLGFGLPPPAVSWGGMLSQGSAYLLDGYWWEVYPVLALLVLTVLAFNFVGEGLRDSLDVRLRGE